MSASYLSPLYYSDFDGIVKRLSTSKTCTNLTFLEQKQEYLKSFKLFSFLTCVIILYNPNQSYFCENRQWYCIVSAAVGDLNFSLFCLKFSIKEWYCSIYLDLGRDTK